MLIDVLPADLCTSNSLLTIRPLAKSILINVLTPLSTVVPPRRVLPPRPRVQPPLGSPRLLRPLNPERGRGVAPREARRRRRIQTPHPKRVHLSCTDWLEFRLLYHYFLPPGTLLLHSTPLYCVRMYSVPLSPCSAAL